MKDLIFYWENEESIILPVGSDNTKYIKYLEVGESTSLQYNVIADTSVSAGLYKLKLYLSYEDPLTSEEKKISTIAGIYVGGTTDFDIALSETSGTEMSFSIANTGSNPAMSVSVIIPQQDGWKTSGSNSVIIGNLNTGDYTIATFSLQKTETRQVSTTSTPTQDLFSQREASSSGKIIVQIAYTDTMGERNIVEKNIGIDQNTKYSENITANMPGGFNPGMRYRNSRQQNIFSQYGWYFIVFIILISAFIFYRSYKKNKLENPNFKFTDLFKKKNVKRNNIKI